MKAGTMEREIMQSIETEEISCNDAKNAFLGKKEIHQETKTASLQECGNVYFNMFILLVENNRNTKKQAGSRKKRKVCKPERSKKTST